MHQKYISTTIRSWADRPRSYRVRCGPRSSKRSMIRTIQRSMLCSKTNFLSFFLPSMLGCWDTTPRQREQRCRSFTSSPYKIDGTPCLCKHLVHIALYRNILIELPQPTFKKASQRPDKCKAFAYAQGWFYNRDSDNRPRVMAMRNGVSLPTLLKQKFEEHGLTSASLRRGDMSSSLFESKTWRTGERILGESASSR